jgi:2-phosphosulfolactate phosphatase
VKIDLLFLPSEIEQTNLAGKIAVVIDVLRASTTIATALHNGCREIVPVQTPEQAFARRNQLEHPEVLLCGERSGFRIEGFDLGNSPFEYTQTVVQDRTLIFSSTNGSQAMVKAAGADRLVVGSFVNLNPVLDFCLNAGLTKPVIICSGKEGRFSLEDTVCGGMMIAGLTQRAEARPQLTDSALSALRLYSLYQEDLLQMLLSSAHGKYLAGLGFQKDLEYSCQIDLVPVVPLLQGDCLVRA